MIYKRLSVLSALAVMGLSVAMIAPDAMAVSCTAGVDCITTGAGQAQTAGAETTLESAIKNITNLLMFAIGAISVIMLILGGIRYTTSNGNPEQIKAAKNTIMYAVIGLVIAILSWAIVTWVVGALTTTP